MLGHWVDLDPYFLHRERVLRLIRTERAAAQLARWDPHRALTPSSPAHLATALGLALPALDTAELPRLVYEHGMAVGRLVGIEQSFCFRRPEDGLQSTDPRIAFEGRLLLIGFTGGRIADAATNRVLLKNFSVVGVHWGLYRQRDATTVRRWMVELLKLAEARQLKPVLWRSFPLQGAPQALAAIASRESYGKVVLIP